MIKKKRKITKILKDIVKNIKVKQMIYRKKQMNQIIKIMYNFYLNKLGTLGRIISFKIKIQ